MKNKLNYYFLISKSKKKNNPKLNSMCVCMYSILSNNGWLY